MIEKKDIAIKTTGEAAKETPLKRNRLFEWKEKFLASKNRLKEKFPARWKYFRAPHHGMSSHHALWIIISEFAVFVCVFAAALYFSGKIGMLPSAEYGQSYALVGEKISENAPIIINLPEGIKKEEAMKSIAFDPAILGSWTETAEEKELVWKPAKPLALGKYYTVNLDTETVHLSDDFLVDENPRIEAIFPSEGSEVNENSNITIIFNRPMVPMTALSELEKKELPIAIAPETEGKWKWISTRNVQFIPKERLRRSTKYAVSIGEGLVSMDGLPVRGRTSGFIVRPLRYVSLSEGQTLFNRPISLFFNQPVDIEKTMREISVINGANNADVPLVAEYAITKTYNKKEKKSEEFINRAVINVYPKEDRLGRARLWNFKSNYRITVKKAYPIEGNVVLNKTRSASIQVPEIISSVSAVSKRSADARPDMFDPEGELIVTFYEEIDRGRSKINAKGLKNIEYGEKCLEDGDGNVIYLDSGECEKGEDKNALVLHFDGAVFSRGEKIPIDFEEIYNASGLKVNEEKITKNITTYPALVITKTLPADGQKKASLTEFIACSNTPIKSVAKEEYAKSLITSGYMVFGGWEYSIYIDHSSPRYHCRIGEYETRIRYGLLPETNYSLTVKFEDSFSQKAEIAAGFTTSAPESQYTRFYNMQKAYNVTPPGKTKLTYAVENLEYVNLHICKLSPEDFLKTVINQPDRFDPPSSSACAEAKTDTISLPKRYWVNNYFQIDLAKYFPDAIGHYIVTFGNPKYREEEGEKRPLYDRTYVSVTRLAVGEKKLQWNDDYYYSDREQWEGRKISEKPMNPGQNLYWVSRFNTFQPMAGAVIFTYTQERKYDSSGKANTPIVLASSIVANGEGIAKGNVTQNVAGVVVKYGQDSAIITPWADTLLYTQSAQNAGKTYLYT
ncbi:MAG: Ig-like domain-containing protein, partial [Candidatus Paceibacterota bacterium]